MQKNLHIAFIMAILLLTLKSPVQANLIDRGNGLIYDTDLNITWLQDAALSGTTMTWFDASAWADNLIFQGFDDWRLPISDSSCTGNNCSGSEMGHLFYDEGITSDISGLFLNVKPSMYWSETELDSDSSQAWRFNFKYGTQDVSSKTATRYAWAVRDGDTSSPVAPEPVSSVLFVAGGTILFIKRYNGKERTVNSKRTSS